MTESSRPGASPGVEYQIQAPGELLQVRHTSPDKVYAELVAAVGGIIETRKLPMYPGESQSERTLMVVDEEARWKRAPLNPEASKVAGMNIAGTVVYIKESDLP